MLSKLKMITRNLIGQFGQLSQPVALTVLDEISFFDLLLHCIRNIETIVLIQAPTTQVNNDAKNELLCPLVSNSHR